MNKKIKDNCAAASWFIPWHALTRIFRATDFKTELRTWVAHHSKQYNLKQSPSSGNLMPKADYMK